MNLTIERYKEEHQKRWDDFVMHHSVNGTFLQTKNFLNYHPEGRFRDASFLVMNGTNILAVVPGCDVDDGGKRTFFSHKGSTFGGIVVGNHAYNITNLEAIVDIVDDFLRSERYEKVILKSTSAIFSKRDMALLDYMLFKKGYGQYEELSFYVDCKALPEDIIQTMTSSKRRDYRYSLKNNFRFECLAEDVQISEFYRILEVNLQKFNATPVHTLSEMLLLKHEKIQDIVDFYGIYLGDTLVAGTMMFRFGLRTLHTQYLAALPEYQRQFPMNYLNCQLIQMAREQGYRYFSFGISTEERGTVLNTGLALFKEGFGARYSVNRSYTMMFDL